MQLQLLIREGIQQAGSGRVAGLTVESPRKLGAVRAFVGYQPASQRADETIVSRHTATLEDPYEFILAEWLRCLMQDSAKDRLPHPSASQRIPEAAQDTTVGQIWETQGNQVGKDHGGQECPDTIVSSVGRDDVHVLEQHPSELSIEVGYPLSSQG
ncbi:hypothetical protein [Enemella sp. A6]|uniref:hypothetical protein n=1 Tax=Enemella sp. A6 TaxID=3440152 RepID=UPI003EBD161C